MSVFGLRHRFASSAAMKWLPLLLLGDLAFVFINTAYRAAMHWHLIAEMPAFLSVTSDDTLPEIYDYLKWILIVGLLIYAFLKTRAPVMLAFAGTFLIILSDDSLQLHEYFGGLLAGLFERRMVGVFRMQDFGELAVWGVLGLAVVALLVDGFKRSTAAYRRDGLPLIYLLGALLFFAIGLDMVDTAIVSTNISMLITATGLLEDGGEMVVASLICAYVIGLAADASRISAPRVPSSSLRA